MRQSLGSDVIPAESRLVAVLPAVRRLRMTCVAGRGAVLPPLPTTALHGAVSPLLTRLSPELTGECGSSASASIAGVTTAAPASAVFAPCRHALGGKALVLEDGESLGIDLALIGSRAIAREREIVDAIAAALPDVGHDPRSREATGLRLFATAHLPEPEAPPRRTREVELIWRTPVRLVRDGHVSNRIDADLLWSACTRRATTLASLFGEVPLSLPRRRPDFEVVASSLAVVPVPRYSSRQRRPMSWPGLYGTLTLAGHGLEEFLPLLRFCERVQIGKATTFGFGAFRLLEAA